MSTEELRKASRKNYTIEEGPAHPTLNDINSGSLQRIADALEIISQDYRRLIEERDHYLKAYREAQEIIGTKRRQVAAYKGQVRRLRKART